MKCDELKAYTIYEGDVGNYTEHVVYSKSEADKVIAHNKYKRCMLMAKLCYSMDCRMLDEASDNGTFFKESWCWKRASWYGKWKRKWLELANKFKEAK